MKIINSLNKLLIIFFIGGLAGFLVEHVFFPYLSGVYPFNKIEWVKESAKRTTVIHQTEKVIIEENTAVEEAINQIQPSLVGIATLNYSNVDQSQLIVKNFLSTATGLIITNDGYLVTISEAIPLNVKSIYIRKGNQWFKARLVKRDDKRHLALLQIDGANWSVISFADAVSLRLGQSLIILGKEFNVKSNDFQFIFNQTTVRSLRENSFEINLKTESNSINGAILANLKGEVTGLLLVNKKGILNIIRAREINDFFNSFTRQ